MITIKSILPLPMLLLICSFSAYAKSEDSLAILAVMQKTFDAVASGELKDWKAIQLPQGTTLSILRSGDPSADYRLKIARNEDFIANLRPDERQFVERWTSEPKIMVHGPIAVVWGKYEFLIDGEFSHCGVDAVDLVKLEGQWKIANFMWTVEKGSCSATTTK